MKGDCPACHKLLKESAASFAAVGQRRMLARGPLLQQMGLVCSAAAAAAAVAVAAKT